MAFEKTVPVWNAPGAEPPDTLKNSGFQVGYKPPADYFNWFWSSVSACLLELQEKSGTMSVVVIGNNDDLDNYVDIGLYTYSVSAAKTITNAPEETQSTLWVLPRLTNDNPENVIQVLYTQTNCIYVRNRADSTWNGWRKMFKDSDVIPIANGGTGAKTAEQARTNLGVAAAEHGRHVPQNCVTIDNWDDAVETGWYMGNNATNAPVNAVSGDTYWFFGYVVAHNSNYVLQEVYYFTSTNDAKSMPKYIRACNNGVWGAWTDVTVQRIVPAAAKLEHIKTLTSDAQEQLNKKMNEKPGYIELVPAAGTSNGGYIDFHFGGSDDDYTSRIVESSSGSLGLDSVYVNIKGQVTASSGVIIGNSGQSPGVYLVRNQKLSATEETPTVNGAICWMYE